MTLEGAEKEKTVVRQFLYHDSHNRAEFWEIDAHELTVPKIGVPHFILSGNDTLLG